MMGASTARSGGLAKCVCVERTDGLVWWREREAWVGKSAVSHHGAGVDRLQLAKGFLAGCKVQAPKKMLVEPLVCGE